MKQLSWPTAAVLIAAILVIGVLIWGGHPLPAALSSIASLIATAVLPSLLGVNSQPPPAPPAKDQQ